MKISSVFALVALAFSGWELAAQVRLTGRVVDEQTGEPLAARLEIRSKKGERFEARSIDPAKPALPYKRQVASASLEHHVTLEAVPFVIDLLPGKYLLTAQKGKEWLVATKEISIADKPVEVTLSLKRWIDLPRLGWYGGDVHSHRPWSQMPNLAMAEDVHVSFPLSHWVTSAEAGLISGNRIREGVRGEVKTLRLDKNHLIHPYNAEFEIFTVKNKSHTLGAILGIGMTGIDDDRVPPLTSFVQKVRAQGGLTDLEKHSWPWSLAIAATHKVDLFELSNNHVWQTGFGFPSWTIGETAPYMKLEQSDQGLTEWGWIDFGFQTYYALLNCGLKIMPSAGTGAGVHPVPFGFSRVYAKTEGPFELKSWLAALKAGRSFVTNGPILLAEMDGQPPGEQFTGPFTKALALKSTVQATVPLDKIEILFNGVVILKEALVSKPGKDGGFEATFETTLLPVRSGWFAIRVFEKNEEKRIRFAHSAPWFVEVSGTTLGPRKEELDHILGTIDREISRNRGVLDDKSLKEFQTAREFYQRLRSP